MKEQDKSMADEKERQGSKKVQYTHWFTAKMKAHKKLRAHHYDAILAFFKSKKLTETESTDKFDSALKDFGF